MIGFLRGKIASKQPPLLVLDVQGVGYEVEAPMSTFYQLENAAEETTLLTHMHVREDAMLLYGFATESERILFKTLLKVNGVGAKMALAVLSALSVVEFCQSVDQADINTLTKIPGVGKKTAERLQIEMRDRLQPIIESGQLSAYAPTFAAQEPTSVSQSSAQIKHSAIEALESLGYKTPLAEKMVGNAFQEGLPLESVIKRALQEVKLS